MRGRLAKSGTCECSISFQGCIMLVFVEFKNMIDSDSRLRSDLVAQVIAEADAADLFNQNAGYIGVGINAILTDGRVWEFYNLDFPSGRF